MHIPREGEFIGEDASLNVGIQCMVLLQCCERYCPLSEQTTH
ncbi:hypothetical protein LINPERHAP1_LOCUS36592, partial [Linum perenne]